MGKRFEINTVNEHGYIHYKIKDILHNITVTCDLNELNSTINELLNEEV